MVEKLERQMNLLATLLQTDRHLVASDIQQRVEGYPDEQVAYRRAFERDKDDLRRLGVPIDIARTETPEGPIDGYRVHQGDYYLHDLDLEADEVVALSMALQLIRLDGSGGAGTDAIWKLGGAAPEERRSEIGAIAIGPAVSQLHQAEKQRVSVRFRYRDELRTVEPWRLAFRRGHWYLSAYDVERCDPRSFRLDRIDGAIETLEERPAAEPRGPQTAERQPWEFAPDDGEPVTAIVRVDAGHSSWARRRLGEDAVEREHDDGSVDLRFEVSNPHGLRSFVLEMLEHAEILSPPELRQDFVDWLKAQAS